MKKHVRYSLFAIIAWFLSAAQISGQEVSTLRFMRMNPYSNFSNPAYFVPYNAYVGVPILGNMNVLVQNSNPYYNKIVKKSSDSVQQAARVDKFLGKQRPNNWLNLYAKGELFGGGFRLNKNFFSYSHRIVTQGNINFSEDILKLLLKGNFLYYGEDNPAKLNVNLKMNMYQELAFGYQRIINEKWSVGVRPKLVFGLANIKTNSMNATVSTNESKNEVRLQYDLDLNISSIVPITIKDQSIHIDMDEFTRNIGSSLFRNIGLGVDLGAEYNITDNIGVSASITDLGFVRWKTNNQKVTSTVADSGQYYDDGSFFFHGMSQEEIQNIFSDPVRRKEFLDTLKEYFPFEGTAMKNYSTGLNTNFSLEGHYDLNKMHRFSAVFQGFFYHDAFYPAFTIAYDGNFFNIIDVCANYTIMRRSYANIGIGLGFNLGIFNIYAATNNILTVFTPLSALQAQLQIGMVFNWGKVNKKDFISHKTMKDDGYQKPQKEPKKSKNKTTYETEQNVDENQ